MKFKFFIIRSGCCSVVLLALLFLSCSGRNNRQASWEFTNIRRGSVERTVSSSGTINPVATVRVLPLMSGKVERVFVDFNDTVSQGDILAQLNTDLLRLQREQMNAAVIRARANHELQSINHRNQMTLAEKGFISEFELRTSQVNLDNLAADLAVAEANLRKIETEINQHAFITSPIDGIILDRNINVGDTVVDSASTNSTSIFTVAENLREMQIEANVGELDITSIYIGQQVRFTLESLPGRRFSGIVENIRMIPVIASNVVSYTVIINVENHDGTLFPGMTCMVDFIVERAEDVLIVPNAALRYRPANLSEEQIADMLFTASLANMDEEQRQIAISARTQTGRQSQNPNTGSGIGGLVGGAMPVVRMPGGARQMRQTQGQQGRDIQRIVMRNLWYINSEGRLDVIQVRTGISDGFSTVVFLNDEFEGMQVILRDRI